MLCLQELINRLQDKGYKGFNGLGPALQGFVLEQLLQVARDSNLIAEAGGLVRRVMPVQVQPVIVLTYQL